MQSDEQPTEKPRGRATYVCQIGCPTECGHDFPCLIGSLGAEIHPDEHVADDFDGRRIHYWRDGEPCRFEDWR